MIEVTFFSALLGGLLTFFAPCTLPLIPAYVGFLGGSAGTNTEDPRALRRRIIRNGLFFIAGFSLIFIIAGLLSGTLGKAYIRNHVLLSQLSGFVILFFGITMLGIIPIPDLLSRLFRVKKLPSTFIPGNPYSAFLLGILFAIGLGPTCLGPILGYITLLAATTGTAFHGALLLSVYSLGIAIPFLVLAALYGSSFAYIGALTKVLPLVTKISGILLIVIGALLIMVNFGMINVWSSQLIGNGWYNDLINYM